MNRLKTSDSLKIQVDKDVGDKDDDNKDAELLRAESEFKILGVFIYVDKYSLTAGRKIVLVQTQSTTTTTTTATITTTTNTTATITTTVLILLLLPLVDGIV